MITIKIKKSMYSLMWNGYATPYSGGGIDWMDGAEYVIDQDLITDDLKHHVNECLFYVTAHSIPGVSYQAEYAAYCDKELKKHIRKLAKIGFELVLI